MSDRGEFRNPLFRNWVRAALGLKYLQQGLSGFSNNLSHQRHQSHLYSYRKVTGAPANSCNECTADNLLPEHPRKTCIQKYRSKCFCNSPAGRRPCPNNFCSRFYDLIVLDHDERHPVWINTDPKSWYSNHWSFARCFLATAGYSDKQSAADTDAAGLLSILINNVEFRASLDNVSNFEMARDTRNDVLHSATFETEEKVLTSIIEQFVRVLQDKKSLINDADAQQAVCNLEKLKRDEVKISCQNADDLRKEAMQAIAEKKEEALREIDKKNIAVSSANRGYGKTKLRRYLIDFYRKYYLKTELSPLLPEEELDVEEVYVPLKMGRRRGKSVETECVHSLGDLFYCESTQAKTIYVSGDAGIGKTTLCRKLISEWCKAHSVSPDISNCISQSVMQESDTLSVTSQENSVDHTEYSSKFENSSLKTNTLSRQRSDSSDENYLILFDSDDEVSDSMCSSESNSSENMLADVNAIPNIYATDKDNSAVMKEFDLL